MGHKSNECLNMRQLQLAEGDIESKCEEEIENSATYFEEVEGDEGDVLNCMLDHLLMVP